MFSSSFMFCLVPGSRLGNCGIPNSGTGAFASYDGHCRVLHESWKPLHIGGRSKTQAGKYFNKIVGNNLCAFSSWELENLTKGWAKSISFFLIILMPFFIQYGLRKLWGFFVDDPQKPFKTGGWKPCTAANISLLFHAKICLC